MICFGRKNKHLKNILEKILHWSWRDLFAKHEHFNYYANETFWAGIKKMAYTYGGKYNMLSLDRMGNLIKIFHFSGATVLIRILILFQTPINFINKHDLVWNTAEITA